MRTLLRKLRWSVSLRTRVLTMALVPSIALLLGSVILASYVVVGAVHSRAMATTVHDATPDAQAFFRAVRAERSVTLQTLSDQDVDKGALTKARKNLNNTTDELFTKLRDQLSGVAPASVERSIDRNEANLNELGDVRGRVDSDDIDLTEAYSYYNKVMDEFAFGLTALAKDFDDAEIAYLRLKAMPLFLAADELSRAHSFAAAAMSSGEMSAEEFRVFSDEIGAYRENLSATEPAMLSDVRAKYDNLRDSDSWKQLTKVEDAVLAGDSKLPVSPEKWQGSVADAGKRIGSLYIEQSGYATDQSLERTKDRLIWSIVGAAAAVLFGIGVLLVALRSANRLVRRLSRLRGETLDMAEQRLPELVADVRSGKDGDAEIDELRVEAGSDEIGQVADAFNKAQQTAIAAAVEEARIREGTRTVFLNIAHRSQVIVHRQLKVLDEAEQGQEDPDQLDLLFQLDHLSTRARRNAENLIILGGRQPGRQWREPVAVDELVRGAVAETEDYARVTVGNLPDAAVQGAAVGDVVHLLAELVDNSTAFSPPQSRVELRGNVVGRGIVLEVEDQGLGIEAERRAEFNRMLANPPEFSVMTLSEEPRLGLFVVARLAGRHGINVTLRESAYGGTRAIVLLRTEIIHTESEPEPVEPTRRPAQVEAPPVRTTSPGSLMGTETTGQLNGLLDGQPNGRPETQQGQHGQSEEAKPPLPNRRTPSRTINAPPDGPARSGSSNGRHHVRPEPRQTSVPQPYPSESQASRQPGEHPQQAAEQPREQPQQPEAQPAEWPQRAVEQPRERPQLSQEPADFPTEQPRPQPTQPPRQTQQPPRREPDTGGAQPPGQPSMFQDTGTADAAADATDAGLSPDRPPLPQRRRQQHIAPQLRDTEARDDAEPTGPAPETPSPEASRSRLTAFQQGTRQAREQEDTTREQ